MVTLSCALQSMPCCRNHFSICSWLQYAASCSGMRPFYDRTSRNQGRFLLRGEFILFCKLLHRNRIGTGR